MGAVVETGAGNNKQIIIPPSIQLYWSKFLLYCYCYIADVILPVHIRSWCQIKLNYIELKEGLLHNMVGFSIFLCCVKQSCAYIKLGCWYIRRAVSTWLGKTGKEITPSMGNLKQNIIKGKAEKYQFGKTRREEKILNL